MFAELILLFDKCLFKPVMQKASLLGFLMR